MSERTSPLSCRLLFHSSAAMSADPSAYKKVIGGGLKFKGGQTAASLKRKATAPGAGGTAKALGLQHAQFKKEPGLVAAQAVKNEEADSAAAASSAASSAAASSAGAIAPPVVLAPGAVPAGTAAASGGSWKLHKAELHDIDSNLTALRDADRQLDRMEPEAKRARILAEKRAAEAAAAAAQLSNHVNAASLAPGVKFSIPNLGGGAGGSVMSKEYLVRKEASVSHATARLDERAKKKSDRYCK
jgi:hypothetical protein